MKNFKENQRTKLYGGFESSTLCEEMFKAVIKMAKSFNCPTNSLNDTIVILDTSFIRTIGKRAELKQAFYDATSADEMLRAFDPMDSFLQEKDLGMEFYQLAQQLHYENKKPETILFYGKRAMKFLIRRDKTTASHKFALMIAKTLYVLGSAYRKLGRYGESLSYLNKCEMNSSKLLKETYYPVEIVLSKLYAVHTELALVKASLGKGDEAIIHMAKMLEIQEKRMLEGSVEIGKGNNVVADFYLGVGNFKEAFPFVLKAVEMYSATRLTNDSTKIALLRRSLGILYCAMKEYKKALEGNGLSMRGLSLVEEMEAANKVLMLGKFEDGVDAMKAVISQANVHGADFTRATASVALARAMCNLEKFGDAKKYLKIAQRIVEKKQVNPQVLSTPLEDLSEMYKEMEELETNGDFVHYQKDKFTHHQQVTQIERKLLGLF